MTRRHGFHRILASVLAVLLTVQPVVPLAAAAAEGAASVDTSAQHSGTERVVIYGPRRFDRASGRPATETDEFAFPTGARGPFKLVVQNGASDGSACTTGSTITLNGRELFQPSDFDGRRRTLARTVELRSRNVLRVRIVSSRPAHVTLTVTAASRAPEPVLESVTPSRARQGQSVTVRLEGRHTHWRRNDTTLSLGGEISVGGAAPGQPGPVEVQNAHSATARIAVSPTAALGPRTARLTTPHGQGTEIVTAEAAFAVDAATPPGRADTQVVLLAGVPSQPGFSDGAGNEARFREPAAVAIGSDEAVYVADAGNHRIRLVRYGPGASTVVSTLAGDGTAGFADGPAARARFRDPRGVAVDAAGAVYVADTGNHRIRRIAADGSVTTFAGDGQAGLRDGAASQARFNAPRGVAADASGNIYVADTGNSAVRRIDSAGNVTTLAGDGTPGSANSPNARFNGLAGVAVDDGRIYVYIADSGNHRIRRLDASGAVVTIAGAERGFADGSLTGARFADPSGIAVDAAGHLVVADATNSLVRLVDADGTASAAKTLAGTGERGFQNGPGVSARFFTPRGVAVSRSAAILVADTGNHVLRRILRPPNVASVTPTSGRPGDSVTIAGAGFDARGPGRNLVTFARAATAGGGRTLAQVTHVAPTELRVVVPADAATGPIGVETEGGSAFSPGHFEVITVATPDITDFTPRSGPVGTEITITGRRLTMGVATRVSFPRLGGGRVDASIVSASPSVVRAIVPRLAITGRFDVTAQGTTESPAAFEVTLPAPTLTSVTPERGSPGTIVSLIGTALELDRGETQVAFTGPVEPIVTPIIFRAPTELRVRVPSGAVTGPVSVTTQGGAVLSSRAFEVVSPVLLPLDPPRAAQGQTLNVTLRGDFTHWNDGPTRASLGGEIAVGEAPAGELGPVTVVDATTAVASLSVSPTAALGPRDLKVVTDGPTGEQTLLAAGAFHVDAVTPPGQVTAVVTTIAGRAGAPGRTDGSGDVARFQSPFGIAAANDDSLYAADADNHTIRRVVLVDTTWTVNTFAGDGTPGLVDGHANSARFRGPRGVAVDASGTVYIADAENHAVRRIAAEGVVSTLAGNGEPGHQDGAGATARFNIPSGLAVAADGDIYVADTGNSSLRRVSPSGEVTTLASGAELKGVVGVAIHGGRIYVYLADTGNHRLRRFDPSAGTVSTVAGAERGFADGNAAASRFADPSGVATDGVGDIIVADATNSLVRLVANPDGVVAVTTIAGTGERGFRDGTGDVARFALPRGATVERSSAIVVADTGNHVLRRILLPPVVSSVAPNPARVGTMVTITGERFDGRGPSFNTVRFRKDGGDDTVAEVRSATRTTLEVTVPVDAATGPVTVQTQGGTGTSPTDFEVVAPPPDIVDFTPKRGTPGTQVTLTGTAFLPTNGVIDVTFAGDGATRVQAPLVSQSDTEVVVVVPAGTVTGMITLTNDRGSDSSPVDFVVPKPDIASFTPTQGPVGTLVTLTGTDFKAETGTTTVTFASANGDRLPGLIAHVSATEVRATVPEGTVTGTVTLSNNWGSDTADEPFTIAPSQEFQITLAPSSSTTVQRSRATYLVHLTSDQTTFTQLARLSTAGLPSGVKATFDPPQITARARSTLTIDLGDANVAPATYTGTVQATAKVDGRDLSRTATLSITVVAAGQTTVAGRVLSTTDEPVMGATVALDGRSVTTDASGSFLLPGVTAGVDRPLLVDGRTASAPNRTYPVITEPATIVSGQANVLTRPFYLPPIDTQYEVDVIPGQDTVATNPKVPGLKMIVPAGANLRNRDGSPVARISITALPPDRTPAELPSWVSTSLVYTSQPGGAIADIAMPVIYPNLAGADAGTRVELYAFNHDTVKWYVYGYGRVSRDGSVVEPEIDPATGRPYGLRDFSWHLVSWSCTDCCGGGSCCSGGGGSAGGGGAGGSGAGGGGGGCPTVNVGTAIVCGIPVPPGGGGPGGGGGGGGTCDQCTEAPVDLSTGIKVEHAVDIVFAGARGGLTLGRTYTSAMGRSFRSHRFGRGTKDTYDVRLTGTLDHGGGGRVILPEDGMGRTFNNVGFLREPDGTVLLRNTVTAGKLGDVLRRFTDGRFEYRYHDGRRLHFDSERRLVATSDANGNTTTLSYSGDRLARITDAVGRSITLEYDGQDRIVRAIDPLNRATSYTYDGAGFLSSVTDPAGHSTLYQYDASGQLIRIVDARRHTTKEISYDGQGRVSSQRFADGSVETYAYQLAGGMVSDVVITDGQNRRERRRFNSAGYVVESADGLGQITRFERNVNNNLPLSTGGTCCADEQRQYDSDGRLLSITDRSGRSVVFEYEHGSQKVSKATDRLGRVTRFRYDARGNVVEIIDPLERSTSFTYDAVGQLTAVARPGGQTTRFEYDDKGNRTAQIDPLGNRTAFTYDGVGNPTSVSDPLGRTVEFTYDALGQISSVKDPAGAATRYEYDAHGNLASRKDGLDNKWHYTYDAKNRLTAVTDPLGRVSRRQYNTNDELVAAISPSGRTTRYAYDAAGRLVTVTDPLGHSVQLDYDWRGNMVGLTDQRGHRTTFVYDDLSRQVERRDPLGRATSFSYDAAGNLVETVDRMGRATRTNFDGLDRPQRITYADAVVDYTYDLAGRRTRIDDTQGGPLEWTYDDADHVLSEVQVAGTVRYTYNAAGERTTMTAADQPPVTYGYDTAGRLETITQSSDTFRYAYDVLSRRTALYRPNTVTTTYAYDALSRLTRLAHTGSFGESLEDLRYTYDADNKITGLSSLTSSSLLPDARLVAEADPTNRVYQAGSTTFTFDAEGHTMTRANGVGITRLDWDSRGRLARAHSASGAHVTYGYDGLGRRTKRESTDAMSFLYDDVDVVRDIGSAGLTDYLNGRRTDDKLRILSSFGSTRYFLQDHLASIIALTTPSGTISESLRYEPFGSAGAFATRYTFTGREWDRDIEGFYYRARHYDPAIARFMSEDPSPSLSNGLNRYGYVQNSPMDTIDPTGRIGIAGVAGAVVVGAGIGTVVLMSVCMSKCLEGSPRPDLGDPNELDDEQIIDILSRIRCWWRTFHACMDYCTRLSTLLPWIDEPSMQLIGLSSEAGQTVGGALANGDSQ